MNSFRGKKKERASGGVPLLSPAQRQHFAAAAAAATSTRISK